MQQRLSLPTRKQGKARKQKLRILSAQDFPVSQLSQRLLQTGHNFQIESFRWVPSFWDLGSDGAQLQRTKITRSEPW